MRPPPRLALALALAVTPDDRPASRRAVLRGAAWVNRSPSNRLSLVQQRKLLAPFSGSQKRFVAFGVAMYALLLRRMPTLLLFLVTVVYMVYRSLAFIASSLGS